MVSVLFALKLSIRESEPLQLRGAFVLKLAQVTVYIYRSVIEVCCEVHTFCSLWWEEIDKLHRPELHKSDQQVQNRLAQQTDWGRMHWGTANTSEATCWFVMISKLWKPFNLVLWMLLSSLMAVRSTLWFSSIVPHGQVGEDEMRIKSFVWVLCVVWVSISNWVIDGWSSWIVVDRLLTIELSPSRTIKGSMGWLSRTKQSLKPPRKDVANRSLWGWLSRMWVIWTSAGVRLVCGTVDRFSTFQFGLGHHRRSVRSNHGSSPNRSRWSAPSLSGEEIHEGGLRQEWKDF